MGFALMQSYKARQGPDCECEGGLKPRTKNLLLGLGALATLGLIASPWLLPGARNAHASGGAAAPSNVQEVTLRIEGMSCPSCSTTVLTALNRTDGVLDARVTYTPPQAVAKYDPSKVDVAALITAITRTGYPAKRAAHTTTMNPGANPMSPVQLDEVRTTFNAHPEDVRVLAILSPTCGECIKGYEVMQKVFRRFDSDRLSGLIVWLPMLAGDDASAATVQAGAFTDDRLRLQGWDTEREIGNAFEKTLDLTRTAWDVYLVYEPGLTWDGEFPPKPSYWMHQLTEDSGADQQYCLNPVTLAREVEKRLEETR
jgi:copper chaperone CopZ